MSVALALYYFSRRLESVQALPLAEIERREKSTCNDLSNCRTTYDIIWSCLTTIFSCTWVAIHPNIPAPYESSFQIGLRRVGIFFMALIAPELVIMWAMRQWIVSRELANEHQGWTQTHGFFALMGGFMPFSSDEALYTLSPAKLEELWKDGKIELPKITKEDIEDKSKGDIISKGFVIIQTSWFMLQCIARGAERLAITELELVTLAFATLNLVTYALWWNKPLNVQRPFAVQLSNVYPDQAANAEEVTGTFNRTIQPTIITWGSNFLDWMLHPIDPFMDMATGGDIESGAKKVPSFYSGNCTWTAALASAAIATIFGALHCIAWSFHFPTHEKEALWHASSLAITCLPITLVIFVGLMKVDSYNLNIFIASTLSWFSVAFTGVVTIMVVFILPMTYIVARFILLVEAFVLLKSMPPGAFQTVHWTTFVPHV